MFLTWSVEGYRLITAIRGTPDYLVDGFVHGDFGVTFGGGCRPDDRVKPCASYPAGEIDELLRERVPVDLQLLIGGVLLGMFMGVWGGRRCAIAAMTVVNISTLLINVAVIEYGFAIPGLFRAIHAASLQADVPVMMGLVVEGVLLITIANFLAGAVQQMLDSKVRLQA